MNKVESNSIKLKISFADGELSKDLILECTEYFRTTLRANSCCVLDKKKENVIMILESFYQRSKVCYIFFKKRIHNLCK